MKDKMINPVSLTSVSFPWSPHFGCLYNLYFARAYNIIVEHWFYNNNFPSTGENSHSFQSGKCPYPGASAHSLKSSLHSRRAHVLQSFISLEILLFLNRGFLSLFVYSWGFLSFLIGLSTQSFNLFKLEN